MAVRLKPHHSEEVRSKIQATKLIQRLEHFVMGKDGADNIEMSTAQVTAALGLLKKSLPDLSSVEMDIQGKVSHEVMLNELK